MFAEWLQKHCTKPCSAKSRNNGNYQFTYIYVWYIHGLLFDEATLVNEAQVPPTCVLCEV